jgi:flagellar assembly protein FliH
MSSRARLLPSSSAVAFEAWLAAGPIVDVEGAADDAAPHDPEAEAFARGLEEGRRQAAAATVASTADLASQLRAALARVEGVRVALLERSEAELVTASLAIARRVLTRELQTDATLVRHLVRSAIDVLRGAAYLRVRVHPSDLETVRPSGAVMDGGVQYVADERLAPGACVVESNFGDVDASLEAQLAEIARSFREGDDAGGLDA